MHTVRREEKRRSREEEGGGREEDTGGGDGGGGGGGGEKQGREGEEVEGNEKSEGPSAGRIRLKGALLKTYILSILIRSIMEVHDTITAAALLLSALWVNKKVLVLRHIYCLVQYSTHF